MEKRLNDRDEMGLPITGRRTRGKNSLNKSVILSQNPQEVEEGHTGDGEGDRTGHEDDAHFLS